MAILRANKLCSKNLLNYDEKKLSYFFLILQKIFFVLHCMYVRLSSRNNCMSSETWRRKRWSSKTFFFFFPAVNHRAFSLLPHAWSPLPIGYYTNQTCVSNHLVFWHLFGMLRKYAFFKGMRSKMKPYASLQHEVLPKVLLMDRDPWAVFNLLRASSTLDRWKTFLITYW